MMFLVSMQETVSAAFMEEGSFILSMNPHSWQISLVIGNEVVDEVGADADAEEKKGLKRWGLRRGENGKVELLEVITRREPEWTLSIKEKDEFFSGVVYGVWGNRLVVMEPLVTCPEGPDGEKKLWGDRKTRSLAFA